MADITKIIDLSNLTQYDGLIKTYIGEGDAQAIKTVLWDSTAEQIKFYKKANATLADTPDYSVSISSSDVQNLQTRVGMTSTLNGYESATNLTDIMNVLTGNSSTAGSVAKAAADAVTTAEGYTDTAIAGLDVSEFALASVSNDVVTIKGIKEVDGEIAIGDGAGISLEEVAYTGAAEDVSYSNTTSGMTATDVQAAIDELAEAASEGVESKTVYITETAGGSGDAFSKRYGIYQGANGSAADPVVGEKLADIDIPKDMVVESGSVVDVVFVEADNSLHEGSASGTDVTAEIKGSATATAADAGKYIKLVIANATSSHLWIKASDLVDVYTAQQDATQVQLAIDSNNVISATIVAGSIGTTELDTSAVTTAKIADDAVTADKVSISAHSESADQTGRTDGLSVTVTTTDGQVSAVSASIAANTYDAYGAATTAATAAVEALDSSTDSVTATADTSLTFLTSVSITDGLISAKKGTTAGFASSAEISALFTN